MGALNNRCRTTLRTQKGTIILTTTHVCLCGFARSSCVLNMALRSAEHRSALIETMGFIRIGALLYARSCLVPNKHRTPNNICNEQSKHSTQAPKLLSLNPWEELKPEIHVFGHTHFGWDAVHDGVRYVQAAGGGIEQNARLTDAVSFGDGSSCLACLCISPTKPPRS